MTISRGYKNKLRGRFLIFWAGLSLMALACITPSVASQPNRFDLGVTETREVLPTFAVDGAAPGSPAPELTVTLTGNPTPSQFSTSSPPTEFAQTETARPSPSPVFTFTPEPDRVWAVRPLGNETLTIRFFTNDKGARCVGITKSPPDATDYRMNTACALPSQTTLVALKAALTDAKNDPYTVVVGHIFDPRIVVVSLEFRGGDNSPAEITDGGFADITAGQRIPLAVVPIDTYGNLVGNRFVFAP